MEATICVHYYMNVLLCCALLAIQSYWLESKLINN